MTLIHVIIPVYNAKRFLAEAVSSVQRQPYEDIDIILVDDGSTDGSSEICDELARKSGRISVFHQCNAGVSAARNAGIDFVLSDDEASGYIAFLDADDCWKAGFLDEDMVQILNHGYDLLGLQTCACTRNLKRLSDPKLLPEGVFPGGARSVLLQSNQSFASMFYSVDLIRQYALRFVEGLKYAEDKVFSRECLYLAESVCLKNREMYLYRNVPESAMKKRKFGIPYYQPIIEAYLESDRKMQCWANEKRGTLLNGRICASRCIVYMVEEHYQQWGSKQTIDCLLEANPKYLAIVKTESPYQMLPRNPRYEEYEKNPRSFMVRNYIQGPVLWLRHLAGALIRKMI